MCGKGVTTEIDRHGRIIIHHLPAKLHWVLWKIKSRNMGKKLFVSGISTRKPKTKQKKTLTNTFLYKIIKEWREFAFDLILSTFLDRKGTRDKWWNDVFVFWCNSVKRKSIHLDQTEVRNLTYSSNSKLSFQQHRKEKYSGDKIK